jgi:transcriptional regulator of heat shock response
MKIEESIFNVLIKDYLERGKPVGSKYLKKRYFKNLASSTIRWYLRKLTGNNLLVNAEKFLGRIPTDKGWRFYLEKNINFNDYKKKDYLLERIKNEEEKIDYLLKKFYLYGIIFHNNNYYYENGLDYIIQNIEFNNKENILQLAYLIKTIKNKITKFDFQSNNVKIFIGREINIANIDNFSVFYWQKKKNKYFLISIKRVDYPLIYYSIINNFI